MTITPDVLEELDFPTPHQCVPECEENSHIATPTPFQRLNGLLEELNQHLMEIIGVISPPQAMLKPAVLTEAVDEFFPRTEGHYCWCSPTRTMLNFEGSFIGPIFDEYFEGSFIGPIFDESPLTVTATTWYGRVGDE